MVTKIQIAGKLKFYSKPYGRQWKWRYQVHGHMLEPKLKIPKSLENVKIIDPLHPETIPKEEKPKWAPPRRHPILESFFPQLTLKDHVNYHEKPIKLFNNKVKFHAGIDQVCLLTKTKPVQGLPSSVKELSNLFNINDQEELVKSYIKQALAFNPTKEPCPGLKIPNDPKFVIGKQYGTPHTRQMQILLDNLIRLSNINIYKKFPTMLKSRNLEENSPILSTIQRADEVIQICRKNDFLITSSNSLPSIADENEINETSNYKFVDMYPIFPTIDLKEENIYDESKPYIVGINNSKTNHIQTIFHLNDDDFTNEQDISRLMMFAFGTAYAKAQLLKTNKELDVDSNQRLKRPLVINAVSVTNQRFNFVTFQLNTLNLKDNNGVKNIAYYDISDNELYLNRPNLESLPYPTQKNIQRLALRHLQYNPEVFKKLLSVVSFGSKLN